MDFKRPSGDNLNTIETRNNVQRERLINHQNLINIQRSQFDNITTEERDFLETQPKNGAKSGESQSQDASDDEYNQYVDSEDQEQSREDKLEEQDTERELLKRGQAKHKDETFGPQHLTATFHHSSQKEQQSLRNPLSMDATQQLQQKEQEIQLLWALLSKVKNGETAQGELLTKALLVNSSKSRKQN